MGRLHSEEKVIRMTIKRHFNNCSVPYEDLYQAGWLGYLQAVNNHNEDTGQMALSYATMYIRKEITRTLRQRSRGGTVEYIDDIHHENVQASPESELEYKQSIQWMEDNLTRLTKEELEVINRRYLTDDPQTLQEVSNSLGLGSRQRAYQIEQSAIDKLKGAANEDIDS